MLRVPVPSTRQTGQTAASFITFYSPFYKDNKTLAFHSNPVYLVIWWTTRHNNRQKNNCLLSVTVNTKLHQTGLTFSPMTSWAFFNSSCSFRTNLVELVTLSSKLLVKPIWILKKAESYLCLTSTNKAQTNREYWLTDQKVTQTTCNLKASQQVLVLDSLRTICPMRPITTSKATLLLELSKTWFQTR